MVEKWSYEAQDITASVRDLPTVKYVLKREFVVAVDVLSTSLSTGVLVLHEYTLSLCLREALDYWTHIEQYNWFSVQRTM